MADMRPAKGKKRSWVVRVRWRNDFCVACSGDILDSCAAEGIEIPSYKASEFMVPYQWLDLKCPHDFSAHHGYPAVISVYAS